MPSIEHHRQHRVGWLRAAVLGANDGIVSTASLIIGVAAAGSQHSVILLAGLAGLIAGAISMAAGEYVSVCAQQDTERSDLAMERESLDQDYEIEKAELAQIYQQRGLDPELAKQVAHQLMEFDALTAHARDEIGITEFGQAQPFLAAFSSALSFTCGALMPLVMVWLMPLEHVVMATAVGSLGFLALLGATSSYLSGAPWYVGVVRITVWGTIAMVATALVGRLFGVNV